MAPRYRQIPTQTPDSYDFNEIPTDFGRMFWLMLPICLDSEGRGLDSVQWLRSRLFPLREDDVSKPIQNTMDWLANRGMIVRYEVDGRKYFYSVNFKKYQSGTEKEALSRLPPPLNKENSTPELVKSRSGVGQELVGVNTMQCNSNYNSNYNSNAIADASENSASHFSGYGIHIFSKVTGMVTIPSGQIDKVQPALESLYYQRDKNEDAVIEYLRPYYEAWTQRRRKDGAHYSKSNCTWLYDWAVAGEIPEPSSNGDSRKSSTGENEALNAFINGG